MRLDIKKEYSLKFLTVVFLIAVFSTQTFAQVNHGSNPVQTDNSTLISYDIPGELKPEEESIVSITMLNNGKSKWKNSDKYQLSLYDGFDNLLQSDVWGITKVPLPYDVNPGEQLILYFKITAPKESGKYNCSWIIKRDSLDFGDIAAATIIVGRDLNNDFLSNDGFMSEFVNLSVPANMTSGEKYKVTVTMKNTGTQPWYSASGGDYKISPLTGSSDVLFPDWNLSPVYLTRTVDTGQSATIEFDVIAPPVPGNHSLQWRMKKGEYFFGQSTSKVFVRISKGSTKGDDPRANNSAFITQNIPLSMQADKDHDVSITMKNTGNKTWIKGNDQLVMVDTDKNLTTLNSWGVGYIQLPVNVSPGEEVTFKFKVRPRDTGWQYFQMKMMSEDGKLFGAATQSVEIIVSGK